MAESRENRSASAPTPPGDGAPRSDELDPELISLRRPRRTVGPLLSLSIIGFCIVIMVRLRADLQFSRQSDRPTTIEDVSQLARGEVGENSYVAVHAMPDHGLVFRVAMGEADYGNRAAPVVGTDGKVWIMVPATPWTLDTAYTHIYSGRVRRLANMPFFTRLREFVAGRPPSPHFVDAGAIRSALETGAGDVANPFGDSVAVSATTALVISEKVYDRALVQAFKCDAYPDRAGWEVALASAGISTEGITPIDDDQAMVSYEVPAPGGVDEVKAKLAEAKLFRARASVVVRPHEARWSELGSSAAGLAIATTIVPWENLSSLAILTNPSVRADAFVLMTGEQPDTYWYILPVYIVLAFFILLFAWGLVRFVRRNSEAAAPAA